MNPENTNGHVLPRPVERLPEYAHAKARQTLAERLIDAFGLSEASAAAIAAAVVDPSEVRKSIGEPTDPDVEKIAVPGGTLLGIRTSVWARRTMPDPRNPRTLPSRRHPFAVDPGSGGEDSKFRPVPEPRSVDRDQPEKAELAVDIESRHHLIWACQQAAAFVLAENDWRASIESQGVMEAVWLVPTTYQHADGSAPATTLTTAEGSSRDTAVHNLLGIHSADVPYDDNDARFRAHIRKLNDAFDRGERNRETVVALRCERIPALILVGFQPHTSGSTGFPTAVKSLVALRHVDPPKPWGEGPENESLADEVLDELHRRDLISSTQRDYFAGSCTRSEAAAAHLPTDPVLRAAQIIQLFTTDDERVDEAIRVAVTSQSTRKRITPKLMNELATALILRAVADEPAKVDQVRRYLRHAFGKSTHRAKWQATGRTSEQLVQAALSEVREAIASGTTDEPGPSSLELAVRASYPLVVSGRLNADRGSSGNDQPDRRTPGEILDTMRRSIHGIHQLGRALLDFETNTPLRAVDESGEIKRLSDDSSEQTVSDVYLRNEFPPPGKAKAARPGDTPTDRYHNALAALSRAFEGVDQAFTDLTKVLGDDSQPMVDARGVEPRLTDNWRALLGRVDEEMVVWARTFRKAYGTKTSTLIDPAEDEAVEDSDPYADASDGVDEDWGNPDPGSKADAAE
ncbi:hypothetical protein [Sinorhizobium meliloti]|uniref:hypothetical protein n=1 Tax=Rhizobium meliloti TaxID=382 RepID=UPI002091B859|nr:hypothetical protein [Sinorhizobium meliloti]MCO5961083.1 hypothetical protein [Sinorhizobium meliloti]